MIDLKTVRKEKNLKQKDVSEKCGCSKPAYSRIESGDRRPSVDLAKRIAKVLDFDWTKFYEDEAAE